MDVEVQTKDGRAIAIEVEYTGTNAEANVKRNLDNNYDAIVVVAIDSRLQKKLRKRLEAQNLLDKLKLVTLAQVSASKTPIWE